MRTPALRPRGDASRGKLYPNRCAIATAWGVALVLPRLVAPPGTRQPRPRSVPTPQAPARAVVKGGAPPAGHIAPGLRWRLANARRFLMLVRDCQAPVPTLRVRPNRCAAERSFL